MGMHIEYCSEERLEEANERLRETGNRAVETARRIASTAVEVRRITPPRGMPAVRPAPISERGRRKNAS